MDHPWLYLFVGIGLLGLVCAVVAVVFANRAPIDSSKSGAPEGPWRGE